MEHNSFMRCMSHQSALVSSIYGSQFARDVTDTSLVGRNTTVLSQKIKLYISASLISHGGG